MTMFVIVVSMKYQ